MSRITDNLKDLALITNTGNNLTVNGGLTASGALSVEQALTSGVAWSTLRNTNNAEFGGYGVGLKLAGSLLSTEPTKYAGIYADTETSGSSDGWFNKINLHFQTKPGVGIDPRDAMKLDWAGRVTMPYQPVLSIYGMSRPSTSGSGSNWNGGTVAVNRGSFGYNSTTGVVTVPATGLYEVSWHLLSSSVNGSGQSVLRVNGGFIDEAFYNTGSEGTGLMTVAASRILSLSANDSVNIERSTFNSGGSWYSTATGNCLSLKMIG